MNCDPPSVRYIGHSTLLIDLDGTRVLTDPLLRDRLGHLRRHAPPPHPTWFESPDVILISHLHLDHLDIPSLLQVGIGRHLVVPAGAGQFMRRRGFEHVEELKPGSATRVGSLQVTATTAAHSGFRPPIGPTGVPVGYVIAGHRSVYFAGDTDIFSEMAELAGKVDVALIPIWGWGRVLGPGHLDPQKAARALALLQPSLAIPIHWGTFAARGVRKRDPSFLTNPPQQFVQYAAQIAPQVAIKVLRPGECAGIAGYGRQAAEST